MLKQHGSLDQGKNLVMIHDEMSYSTLLMSLYKTFGRIEINQLEVTKAYQLIITVYLSQTTLIKLGQSDELFINQSSYFRRLLDPNDSI